MIDELNATLRNKSLPLPARLDAARQIIRVLTDAIKEVRDTAEELVCSAELDPDLLATLYWEYGDLVPTKLLGQYHQIREIIEPRCPWTYPCPGCGVDQPVTSRTALQTLQRIAAGKAPQWRLNGYLCASCRKAREAARVQAYQAQEEAYRRRLHELRTMPYHEYLQTPEWQQRRKARLKAARYRCQVCNASDRPLNVHHRTYERRGAELASDLIVLCEPCHHLFHRNGSLAKH